MPARALVVYVHGLWMVGAEAVLLKRRLWRERGYRLHVFQYGSVRQPLSSVLGALRDTLGRLDAPQVHLLGHSLGGALILHYLERYPMRQPGRVVLMGSPVLGSRCAQVFGRWVGGRRLMGETALQLLSGTDRLGNTERRWVVSRELGIIAGSLPIGFGQLLQRFGEPNDGVVAVSETRLPGAQAYLTLPVNHMGLLLSAGAARETGSFLQYGRFGR